MCTAEGHVEEALRLVSITLSDEQSGHPDGQGPQA
jgi:hypothetical protein